MNRLIILFKIKSWECIFVKTHLFDKHGLFEEDIVFLYTWYNTKKSLLKLESCYFLLVLIHKYIKSFQFDKNMNINRFLISKVSIFCQKRITKWVFPKCRSTPEYAIALYNADAGEFPQIVLNIRYLKL